MSAMEFSGRKMCADLGKSTPTRIPAPRTPPSQKESRAVASNCLDLGCICTDPCSLSLSSWPGGGLRGSLRGKGPWISPHCHRGQAPQPSETRIRAQASGDAGWVGSGATRRCMPVSPIWNAFGKMPSWSRVHSLPTPLCLQTVCSLHVCARGCYGGFGGRH
jgi:hypothetical protein